MKRYSCRDGVVLTEVCGEYLLVSASALRDVCPYVTTLNETSAFLWKQLQSGATEEELVQAVGAEYEVDDPAALRDVIAAFLQQMQEYHYLIVDGQEEDHDA